MLVFGRFCARTKWMIPWKYFQFHADSRNPKPMIKENIYPDSTDPLGQLYKISNKFTIYEEFGTCLFTTGLPPYVRLRPSSIVLQWIICFDKNMIRIAAKLCYNIIYTTFR